MFEIPEKFNKNAPDVRAMGLQAQTGKVLIEYMCERVGVADLANSAVLDVGCGCRFADSILNLNLPIGSYTGVDVDAELIGYFNEHLHDDRFQFRHWDARNPMYNPNGTPMTADTRLPVGDLSADIGCMFSVITHQVPEDAASILSIVRKHVRRGGYLFFSADIYAETGEYKEFIPEAPTQLSRYSLSAMKTLVAASGWTIVSYEERNPRGLPILSSFLCT